MSTTTPSLTSILEIHSLSSGACRALIALISFRNRESGQCNPRIVDSDHPDRLTLCQRIGAPKRTVCRWLAELRRKGVITCQKRRYGGGSWYEFPALYGAKSGTIKSAKSGTIKSAKSGTIGGPHSLYELAIEPIKKNRDAAVSSEGLRKPARTAAAAIPPASHRNQEHERPAAPPVIPLAHPVSHPGLVSVNDRGTSPPAQQFRLDLQPCDPIHEQAAALAEELHAVHPQPGLPNKAIGEVEKILRASEDPQATVELIRANHAAWKLHWEMLRPGQFIPQLWRWFRDGEWKRAVGKPVRRETWYEQQQRHEVSPEMLAMFDKDVERFHAKNRRFAGA